MAARNAALTSGSGSSRPAVSFCAVPGASGRICPSARAAPRRTRGSGASTACVSGSTAGRPIWARASAIGSMRLPSWRRASSSRGAASGPDLAEQERGVPRDAVVLGRQERLELRRHRGSNARRSTSRLTTASRTRSSSCRRFSSSDRQQVVVGQLEPRQRPDGRRPDLRGRVVRRIRGRPGGPGRPARTGAPGPRPPARGRRRPGPPEAAIRGSTAAGPIRPSAERGLAPDPLAPVAEQGDQVGDGRPGVGPDPPQAHDDLRPDVLLPLLQQAAQALDGGLADGRQRQGRPIILVRLLLPLAAVVGPQGVDERGDGRRRRRARAR